MKQLIFLFLMLFSVAAFSQTVVVDSIRSFTDTLGVTFYQRYTEVETDAGGMTTTLSDPLDSATFVNQYWVAAHNDYMPLTDAKRKVLQAGLYNSNFNSTNSLLAQVNGTYWDNADNRGYGAPLEGLWRIVDTEADTMSSYQFVIQASTSRLFAREIDVSISRLPDNSLGYTGSPIGPVSRVLIRNPLNYRLNIGGSIREMIFLYDIPNDDLRGTERGVWVTDDRKYRLVHLKDIEKI